MPGVARVLQHFGDADAGAHERGVDRLVQGNRAARIGGVIVADQRHRRLAKILERRPLAEKLRIDRNAELLAVRFSRCLLEQRNDPFVGRPGQDGAADDDDVVAGLLPQRCADL